jgi:hypothetical protein
MKTISNLFSKYLTIAFILMAMSILFLFVVTVGDADGYFTAEILTIIFLFIMPLVSVIGSNFVGFSKLNYLVGIVSMLTSVYLYQSMITSEQFSELISVVEVSVDSDGKRITEDGGWDIDTFYKNDTLTVIPATGTVIMITDNKYKSVYSCDVLNLKMGNRLEVYQYYRYGILGHKQTMWSRYLKSSASDSISSMINYR